MSSEPFYRELSESLQDYLKITLDLINKKRVARIKEIARRKGVSMPSVTEAMHKLATEGFVNYEAHEFIELTQKGEKAAHSLLNRHIFLTNFLEELLDINEKQALKEACALEHHLSPQTLERMVLLYQFLNYCPKKGFNIIDTFKNCLKSTSSILTDDPECQYYFIKESFPHRHADEGTTHLLLSNMKHGQQGCIKMIGPDLKTRHEIIEKGLLPGIEFTIEKAGNKDQPYTISIDNYKIQIDQLQADLIEVVINDTEAEITNNE